MVRTLAALDWREACRQHPAFASGLNIALGKVTQLTYGVIAPGNISANLMTAGVTAGAAATA